MSSASAKFTLSQALFHTELKAVVFVHLVFSQITQTNPFNPQSQIKPPNQAGLLLTNSPKSSLVATPNTNLLAGSVTTANSCFSPPFAPSKKACKSSSGVSIVMRAYFRPFLLNFTIAFSTLSFSVMLPDCSCALIDGVEM